jgi:hypothetical protein
VLPLGKGELEGDGLGASTVEKKYPLNPKIPRENYPFIPKSLDIKDKNFPRKNTNIKNRGKWTNLSLPQCLMRKREIPLCGRFCGRCGQKPLTRQKQNNPNLKLKPLISQIYTNLFSGRFTVPSDFELP